VARGSDQDAACFYYFVSFLTGIAEVIGSFDSQAKLKRNG